MEDKREGQRKAKRRPQEPKRELVPLVVGTTHNHKVNFIPK